MTAGAPRHRRLGLVAFVALVALTAACTYEKEPDEDAVDPLTDEPASTTSTLDPALTTTSTTLPEPDVDDVAIALEEIVQLEAPTAMAARPNESALYVAQQGGQVRRIEITSRRGVESFTLSRNPALDLSEEVVAQGEQGLLGIAFSLDGNRLYVAYTGLDARQYLVEFAMSGGTADRRSRRDLLVIEDERPNHNGGMLAFGPDGYLYWAMGDGGGGGDPEGTGQDPTDLLGSILRIDPDVPAEQRDLVPYVIPDGNPFADGADGAPEVWAYGLRNPWRFSFDKVTGDLWIGDVGQDDEEEVDLLPADSGGHNAGRGANLGWSALEGNQPFEGDAPDDAVGPLFVYGRDDGACSVTGGYVYRGALVPSLQGIYVFADFCEGRLRGVTQRDGELNEQAALGPEVASPTSFGQDLAGELYVLSQAGPVYRIVPAG